MALSRREILTSSAYVAFAAALSPALAFSAFAASAPTGPKPDPAFKRLTDGFTDQMLEELPETATSLGLDKGHHAGLKRRLYDRSFAGVDAEHAHVRARLEALKAFDAKPLMGQDLITYDCLVYAHDLAERGQGFGYGDNSLNAAMSESATPYVVSQETGAFSYIPEFLNSQHQISSAADADAYVARVEAYAAALDQETLRITRDFGQGVSPPDYILDTALQQMTGVRATSADQAGLVSSIAMRAKAKGLPATYAARTQQVVESKVYPALDRQIAQLKAMREKATHDAGVWKLPQGEAYYSWLLEVGTSTKLTAQEVHQIGLDQAKAIGAQMDTLLRAQGMTRGTVGERMAAASADPKHLFPDSEAGRQAILDYLNDRIAAVRPRLPLAFHTQFRAPVVVKRVPPEIQAGASLGYMNSGSLDGSRPSTYYINLEHMQNWPKFKLPTLTFHETVPGHAWQGAYLTERREVPVIRNFLGFNAYVEGYALYAEQLADELGMYADDPWGKLGYLLAQQFRACRLVVDTGVHALRWSREQAIQYLVDTAGYVRTAATSEIDRYTSTPGQACGYKIGHLEINRLRDKAKMAMGKGFDLRGYDDLVVKSGGVPLTVLETLVDDWSRSAKAA